MRVKDFSARSLDSSRTAFPMTLGPTLAMAGLLMIWPLGFIAAMIQYDPLPAPPLPSLQTVILGVLSIATGIGLIAGMTKRRPWGLFLAIIVAAGAGGAVVAGGLLLSPRVEDRSFLLLGSLPIFAMLAAYLIAVVRPKSLAWYGIALPATSPRDRGPLSRADLVLHTSATPLPAAPPAHADA